MKLKSFTVLPSTPPRLKPLLDMAYNMWFSWNYEEAALFKRLDRDLWRKSSQNPVRTLCLLSQERLEEVAKDEEFCAEMDTVYRRFKSYMESNTWFQSKYGTREKPVVGYFSLEFGMHESLPIYSGGLGVLAGDHVKSASDLGIPLVGVGLLYRQGYFQQYLNADGLQQESYPENDWYSLPVRIVNQENGHPLVLSLQTSKLTIYYQVWRVSVGRVTLYLLDTNLEENSEYVRNITTRLYEADREIRLLQEILLGIGGVQALKAINEYPKVFHINEGHSALLMLERVRQLMVTHGLTLKEAREATWGANIFTTHTPVAAGNERFTPDLLKAHLENYVKELGLSWDEFLALGRENPQDKNEEFCLTVLAIHMAAYVNGVSKLHGKVSRKLWEKVYPGISSCEIPIGHITNGIHIRTWLSPHLGNLGLRYLGSSFLDEASDIKTMKMMDKIPNRELWEVHEYRRNTLIRFARKHLRNSNYHRSGGTGVFSNIEILDPKALTIGFARRFATYKRGNLLLRNPERLLKLLRNETRPLQFVFAGKAHPADSQGKEIIKNILDFASKHDVSHRLVFLENYDMNIARHLVQGVDVWLNNPRRPLEASGTSGMKAAINGCLNLSIPDGWWDEADTSNTGWNIGNGEEYHDSHTQDEMESNLLYQAIEKQIIPTFYDNRDHDGVPVKWVEMMKASMSKLGLQFNTHRMVKEYFESYYKNAEKLWDTMSANSFAAAKEMANWKVKLEKEWPNLEIVGVESNVKEVMYAGSQLQIQAQVKLGGLSPENLMIEVYHGVLNHHGDIEDGSRVLMTKQSSKDGIAQYEAVIPCNKGGRYGFAVRALPGRKELAVEILPGFIKWAF